MMLSDFYIINDFQHEPIEGIFIGAYHSKTLSDFYHIQMSATTWESWEMPIYHERLKQSYDIIREAFKKYR